MIYKYPYSLVNIIFKITPVYGLDIPTPPAGSDYDQSTLDITADTGYVVAGEIGGDPTVECYCSQGLRNDRNMLTGFGLVLGYTGVVTNDILIGIASTQVNPNNPDAEWIAAGMIDHTQMQPDTFYYVTAELVTPVEVTSTIYIISATDEPWTENNGFLWPGMSSDVYSRGQLSAFNGTNWNPVSPSCDTHFYSFTETENGGDETCEYGGTVYQPGEWRCEGTTKYTCSNGQWIGEQNHPDCIGCDCETYDNQVDCEMAKDTNGKRCCYWYQKYFWEDPKCYENPQNMLMDYLPFIGVGAAAVLIIGVLLSKPRRMPYYPPPPQHYYPPPPQHYYPSPSQSTYRWQTQYPYNGSYR